MKLTLSGVRAVQNSLNKFKNEIPISAQKSVALTARAMLNAWSGTTRVAPKHRKVVVVKKQEINPRTLRKRTRTIYGVEKWGKNHQPYNEFIWWARSRADVKKSPDYTIFNRGLAKKTWWYIAKKTKTSGASNTRVDGDANRIANQVTAGSTSNLNKRNQSDYQARLTNKLNYLDRAFYSQGPKSIDSVYTRAQRWLEEYCKREIKKRVANANKKVSVK